MTSTKLKNDKQDKGKMSFYPLRFNEVISDVLKVKPERKEKPKQKAKKNSNPRKRKGRSKT